MGFKRIASNIQTSLHGRDAIVDNQSDGHLPQAHPNHFSYTNGGISHASSEPGCEKFEKDDRKDKGENGENGNTDKIESIHGGKSIPDFSSREGRTEMLSPCPVRLGCNSYKA